MEIKKQENKVEIPILDALKLGDDGKRMTRQQAVSMKLNEEIMRKRNKP